MKYDVFISYSSKDQKVVEGLCAYLEQYKIRCFVAYRDIPRGVVWAKAIVEALDESRMMVVVFSNHFNDSDQVDREIELASEDKKPILTFRVTKDAFKGAKKYYLKNINWIDAFPNPSEVFGCVVENVAKLLGLNVLQGQSKPIRQSVSAVSEYTPTVRVEEKAKIVNEEAWAKWHAERARTKNAVAFQRQNTAVVKSSVKTYKIGDYYNENGKEGVVFEVSEDGRHGKIVSLDQTKAQWCTKAQHKKNVISRAYSKIDGKENTDMVVSWENLTEYPAFYWCRNKGKDWYLPSIEELELLFFGNEVRYEVGRTLRKVGGDLLCGVGEMAWYWSSTEVDELCALHIYMLDKGSYSHSKVRNYFVRAVARF